MDRQGSRRGRGSRASVVIGLIPTRTDTTWWHRDVAGSAHVCLIKGRLVFGDGRNSAPFSSAIVAWGANAALQASMTATPDNGWHVPPTANGQIQKLERRLLILSVYGRNSYGHGHELLLARKHTNGQEAVRIAVRMQQRVPTCFPGIPDQPLIRLPQPVAGAAPAPTEECVPRRDPVLALAEQMVSAVLAVAPEAWTIGRTPGAIVVARVPQGWGNTLPAPGWRSCMATLPSLRRASTMTC